MTYPTPVEQACEAAIGRVAGKGTSMGSDVFADLGEALFWLCALAESNDRHAPLLDGLQWARNRVAHGAALVSPGPWLYGSEPGMLVPGASTIGAVSGHEWLPRSRIPLGPGDRPKPSQEKAYDELVAGKLVLGTLQSRIALARVPGRSGSAGRTRAGSQDPDAEPGRG